MVRVTSPLNFRTCKARRVGNGMPMRLESMYRARAPAAALDASRTRQRAEQISPLLAQTSAATRPSAPVSVTRMPRAKFALLASSGSGSTWVNHMLSSHPCISSAGEYLLGNVSEQQVFRAPGGVSVVLDRIVEKVDEQLRQHRRESREARACTRLVAGVKLKAFARDVLGGPGGNLRQSPGCWPRRVGGLSFCSVRIISHGISVR